ncbi:MAG: VirB3 family type IV secretion system protein [Desulfobacteraceae bacterium]|nr:VirB3 family type IV secretion system protein [Desulfobacteraceae bacterium]
METGEKQTQPLFTTMYQSSTLVFGLPRDYMLLACLVCTLIWPFGKLIITVGFALVLYVFGWFLKRWDDEFVTILLIKIKNCGSTKTKYDGGNFYGS